MSNNNSSECNTRFDDTYLLYKYNIDIDYYDIRNRNEERNIKKMSNNNISECNTRFDDTYHLKKYNIGIDYYHIRNRNKERHIKKEKCQIITVVNVILDLMTLTYYTQV